MFEREKSRSVAGSTVLLQVDILINNYAKFVAALRCKFHIEL